MKIICTLLFIIFAYEAKAQNVDYIITPRGDTVKCEVRMSPWHSGATYSVSGGKFENVTSASVKEYFMQRNELRFKLVYRDSSNKPEYLRVLQNGTISLYYRDGSYTNFGSLGALTISPTVWFIGKNSDRVITLKSTGLFSRDTRDSRKDAFGEMLKDKSDTYQKYIEEKKFTAAAVLNLVHLYNTGQPYVPPVKKPDPNAKKDDLY